MKSNGIVYRTVVNLLLMLLGTAAGLFLFTIGAFIALIIANF